MTTINDLGSLGNVDDAYDQVTKRITPRPALSLPNAFLKWYDLCRDDKAI